MDATPVPLCRSAELVDGGLAVPFDVVYGGQTCRAFAVRWQGRVHAYLNRCAHVAMEMDWYCGNHPCTRDRTLYRLSPHRLHGQKL